MTERPGQNGPSPTHTRSSRFRRNKPMPRNAAGRGWPWLVFVAFAVLIGVGLYWMASTPKAVAQARPRPATHKAPTVPPSLALPEKPAKPPVPVGPPPKSQALPVVVEDKRGRQRGQSFLYISSGLLKFFSTKTLRPRKTRMFSRLRPVPSDLVPGLPTDRAVQRDVAWLSLT